MRGFAAVGLYAPKCEANVGGAMRACLCYGAAMVAVQGQRFHRVNTDTQKAWRSIPVVQTASLLDSIPFDCIPVVVELTDKATSLAAFAHPERAFYIFGPEDGSVPVDIQERVSRHVKIPTRFCMNLASTVNVVLYDRMVKRGDS